MSKVISILSTIPVLLIGHLAFADVKLPAIFSEGMVLQQGIKVPVWGWAEPQEKVTVALDEQTHVTQADENGEWQVELDPLSPGHQRQLHITANNNLTVSNVLVGEVWLCSGQSNMAMTVNRAKDYEAEKARADLPQIRMFKVSGNQSATPQANCTGKWSVCGTETVGGFTATGYFFAKDLHKTLKVPVGLINSSVGGTPIESWISEDAQRAEPMLEKFFSARDRTVKTFDEAKAKANYQEQLAAWKLKVKEAKAAGKSPPKAPRDPVALAKRKRNVGGLYNGMIAPVIHFGFRGGLWYQGEANSTPDKAEFYHAQLSLLVSDWRKVHGQGNFPFAWVQLPNYSGNGRNWPVVREGMLKTLKLPHTGMAITVDVGDSKDIHPKNKQAVGARLANWALADVYQKTQASPMGPIFEAVEFKNGEASLTFQYAPQGLTLLQTENSRFGLVIAGEDQVWHVAKYRQKGSHVVVSSPEVPDPVAVRYGWANEPLVLITDQAGIPASPFRTDQWENVTPFDQ